MLAACGGGDSGTSGTLPTVMAPPPPAPTPTVTDQCSLRQRQDFALATLREWYLFPETLPASLDPSPYATVGDYIDALTATARAQGRDRYFTYITSIAGENAFFSSGASAGFGIRLSIDATGRRLFISESFEGAPALAAGIDRGDEIVAIGTNASNLRTVSDIIAAEGTAGVTNALGPNTAGTARTLRVTNAAGTRDITVTKADYSLSPVSSRYGAQVIDDGGRKVAYLNLRTFITAAEPQLRTAFQSFRAQGITNFIVDLRYNGGGLINTAELFGDLLGGNRAPSDVFDTISFRPEKASNNTTHYFMVQPESVSPARIAFIGTGATASASELLINAFTPFLGANSALIGANTYGKPVGQVAIDKAECDDRIRVIAFSVRNGANSDAYFNGLAGTVGASCTAVDDVSHQLGDPREGSTRQALDFLAGKPCTPIAAGQRAQSVRSSRDLLIPAAPTAPQREVPGAF